MKDQFRKGSGSSPARRSPSTSPPAKSPDAVKPAAPSGPEIPHSAPPNWGLQAEEPWTPETLAKAPAKTMITVGSTTHPPTPPTGSRPSDSPPDYHLSSDPPPALPAIPNEDARPGTEVVHWLRKVHETMARKDHRTSDTGPDLVLMRIETEEAIMGEHYDSGGVCGQCVVAYPCRTQYLLAAGWRNHDGYVSQWAELAYWWRGPFE